MEAFAALQKIGALHNLTDITGGLQGPQGNQGDQGPQGNQGNQGNQGAQGNQGNQGAQGNQGNQGAQGNQGNQGAQGNQGNQGNQGVQGSVVSETFLTAAFNVASGASANKTITLTKTYSVAPMVALAYLGGGTTIAFAYVVSVSTTEVVVGLLNHDAVSDATGKIYGIVSA